MTEEIEDDEGHELRARVFTPKESSGATALVLGGGVELEPADIALAERLSSEGLLAHVCALSRDGERLSDRDATQMATAELSKIQSADGVDPGSVVLAGCGRGGTLAVLCACRMDGAAVVLDFGGPLVYPTLDEERSVQPLEMLLNLSAPLFMAFGDDVSAEDRSWVEQALSQFARTYNIVTPSTAGSALFTTDGAATETTWEAAKAFLQLHLETP